jgi:2-polyprenyl-3-methyl-5-hydroxy-6-metoxy-1,4-benzoquinol methylase
LHWLKQDLRDCETILDVGCGALSPILKIGYGPKADGVDIFRPYVMMHQLAGNYRDCKVRNILETKFEHEKYDAVVVCDVLEHLSKDAVRRGKLIETLEKVAQKKIVIFTPNGDVANREQDGNVYQKHLSIWEPSDFADRGYQVKGATGLRYFIGTAL